MAFSTVSALIDFVRARMDHSGLTDGECLHLLNDAQRRLAREYPLRFFQAKASGSISVASPQTFALPTALQTPTRLYSYISGEASLVQGVPYFTAIEQYAGATAENAPVRWAVYGTVGYLFPPLSSAVDYELYYQQLPPDFSGQTASNAFLQECPEALEYATLGSYHISTGELKLSEQYFKQAVDSIKALMKEGEWAEEARLSPIPSTPGSLRRKR